MRIVIAPDSFKESLSAPEAARAIAEGVRRVCPQAEILEVPMADGGEGTVAALVKATGGRIVARRATGPLGEQVGAFYGILGDDATAVVETASASGIHLIPKERRDPCRSTTRGTGELILHALEQGISRLIVGLGGSATNDGGAGMAQALGYALLDHVGKELPPGGAALADLARIETPRHRQWENVDVLVACDVTNPLTGPHGASHVYGPQKGARPEDVERLDAALGTFADVVQRDLGVAVSALPGAGAAGGLGAGLVAFLGAAIRSGAELLAEASGLEAALNGASLAITGEGRLDHQSAQGKTPVGVARLARRHGVPCVALVGALADGHEAVLDEGVTAAFAISSGPGTLEHAIMHTRERLADTAESVMRLWLAATGHGT